MPTYLIDGTTPLPANGDTGWGTTLNAAINAIDGRFTWTGGEAVAKKAPASGITGTTLPATLVNSSLTSVGTLTGLTVSGTTTLSELVTGATAFSLINTTATTVNFAGAATALTVGATTGTTTVRNNLTVTGDLTVNGTTTTVNSTTISVDDINITLGDTASPTNVSADGGGITLRGTTNKTLNWVNSTSAWTSSEDFNLVTGKVYEINGTAVLSATALGTGVISSSLTSVGTISSGTWNGSVVAGQYGGTGVANTGKTITVSGNTTIGSSTHTVTFTTGGNTSVTLPTTGTLATLAGSESLTNKKLGSLTSNGLVTTSGGDGTLSVTTLGSGVATFLSTPTSANLISAVSDETGSGSLVFGTSPTLATPNVTTSLAAGSASFDLINTTATTVNFAGAATALTVGATTGTTTVRNNLTVTGTTTLGPSSVSAVATNTYILALADQGKILEATHASGCAITVPPESSQNFPVGSQITIVRNTSGSVSFAAGSGVTIRSDSSKFFIATQYSVATLVKRGSNEWYLFGNLSAS